MSRKTKTIPLRVSPAEKREIDRRARKQGISVSSLIRDALGIERASWGGLPNRRRVPPRSRLEDRIAQLEADGLAPLDARRRALSER